MRYIPAISLTFMILSHSIAGASDYRDKISNNLSDLDLCSNIKFDLRDVASMLGVNISLPKFIDTHIGWDKNYHSAEDFYVDGSGNFKATIFLGCEPSSEGAIIKAANIAPSQVRLKERVVCEGNFKEKVTSLSCQPSGTVGKLWSALSPIEVQLEPIIERSLKN